MPFSPSPSESCSPGFSGRPFVPSMSSPAPFPSLLLLLRLDRPCPSLLLPRSPALLVFLGVPLFHPCRPRRHFLLSFSFSALIVHALLSFSLGVLLSWFFWASL